MNEIKNRFIITLMFLLVLSLEISAQQNSATHTRGKLWETLYNWGFIGDPGAWDFAQVTGVGFFPGFAGFDFPPDEITANGYITDANFHNFKTGPWIIAKNALTPVPPAFNPERQDFLIYHASMSTGPNGVLPTIMPFQRTQNFANTANFNPLLPEEMNYVEFTTSTGILVKQRSMAWSYPGYDDFIIYDYTFVNTGDIAVPSLQQNIHIDQTLEEVWFVFHSGIQVSTKGVINFHYNSDFLSSAVPAGAFGYHPGAGYTDFYEFGNRETDGEGLYYFSRDYNGGREPVPWDQYGFKTNWQNLLRVKPEYLPELQDPAAFGFTFLYRTPHPGSNGNPLEADPAFFNIYSDEGDKFAGKVVDFESFGLTPFSRQGIYDFARHEKLPSSNGNLYCWYTSSFGPYRMAIGDSVRLIVAEISGEMDLNEIIKGDPNHYYPDSTIADFNKNLLAVRNAVKWGINANVDGLHLAADVPDGPPAPNCRASNASAGSDTAIIAVQWDKLAETSKFTDGAGNIFYDGATDLSGYRVFRGTDKRGIWDLVADIPRSQLDQYWNEEGQTYQYLDKNLQFGFSFYYYVQAYYSNPKQWVSANQTIVNGLGELVSGDYNRAPLTSARPGPVDITKGWDVFVAPNPYVEYDPDRSFSISDDDDHYKIEFRNLPEKATIKIFNIAGDLIYTINHGPDANGNLFGSVSWDQRSESGLLVAPGLYVYVVQSESDETMGSRTTGKLMIIR